MAGDGAMADLVVDGESLTLEALEAVARGGATVRLTESAREKMAASRAALEARMGAGRPLYGVNTGFGSLSDVTIEPAQVEALQLNLLRSHAFGVGAPAAPEATRATILLRANVLAKGFSGVRPLLVDALLDLLNRRVHPVIPEKGSVGASGDLAPLAHLALVLVGEGEAVVNGARLPGGRALAAAGLAPVTLQAKEGLALVNGTCFSAALGALALLRAERLARIADVAGALSLDALRGTPAAFDPRVHRVRPHPGHGACAANLVRLLEGSEIRESHRDCPRVQDQYSLRCMPQVHGATRDALAFARRALEVEANAATDNPLVFEDGEVVSAGNFHGQPIALALDVLGMGLAELGAIAERRIDYLVNPKLSDLPPFLTRESGLHSGLMIAQVTAAALASENKRLAVPAGVDSIPTSGGKEDHVSMSAEAARKALTLCDHVRDILAIELLCACQGLDFLEPLRSGRGVEAARRLIRRHVPPLTADRAMTADLESIRRLLDDAALLRTVEDTIGPLG
jgi:histidine ammonia-lyase